MRITLKQLEYFVATGEAGSIKLAAKKINISQPSISSAISYLERELQVQLFVRHHAQGLSLTSSGKTLMRDAKILLRQADSLYTVAAELNNEVTGNLSVGCMVTLAPMVAPALGFAFKEMYPNVKLNMTDGSHEELLDRLRKVEIDIAISYDLVVPDEISFEPLASLPPHVLISTEHPLAGSKSIDIHELENEPMVMLSLPQTREYFMSLFETKGITPNIRSEATHQGVVRTMVANNYGFSITNVRPKTSFALDGKTLQTIPLSGDHKPMHIGIMTLRYEHKPRLLMAFEEHCRSLINGKSIPGMSKY